MTIKKEIKVKHLYNISMNALFLLNKNSGHGLSEKKKQFIISELEQVFSPVTMIESKSKKHFITIAQKACGEYDVLVFAGGDGTFNMVANAIADQKNRPILGIIPTGTINDAAKIIGVGGGVKKALKVIKQQKTKKIDIGKLNDTYFVYVAVIGAYADIPYTTKRNKKARVGRLAYYFKAVPKVFEKRQLKGTITFEDGTSTVFEAPFIMVMNGTHIGGFKINPKSNSFDGEMDLFWTEPTIFNSLLRYILFRSKIHRYKFREITIRTDCLDNWDLDGEKGPKGDVKIKVFSEHLEIFSR